MANDPMTDSLGAESIADPELHPVSERGSGQQTARRALKILARSGFVEPSAHQRRNIAMAFAAKGSVVYGKAFDCLRVEGDVDLDDLTAVEANLDKLTLYEVKSTRRPLPENFEGYFFSISTAEVLVAQSLGKRFRFAFVDTSTERYADLTLRDVYARAKAIYPTWSIRF